MSQWEVEMSLNGKHGLITGGDRGIGRGIALKLAESGVKVAVHYFQNEAAAKRHARGNPQTRI
jgi:NAD(P)-dependent dehydrogenase (short-subunit alcohol dehydrogenase family)